MLEVQLMREGGFEPEVIESAWQLLLGGVLEQEELNRKSSDAG